MTISKSLVSNVFILSTKDNLGNLTQNPMLEFSLVTYFQVKLLEFLTKKTMVVEKSIYVIFMNLIILFKKYLVLMIYVMPQTQFRGKILI